ncbi:MAG: dihydropteroate synthase, partial [Gemmatimonadota bacterium]|nr:dihydropteroate synthase [Gemmatimonadota bacterium]
MERLSEKPLQTDGRPEMRWATGEREPLTFEGAPKIMGVLNLTPDSFYDGGRLNDVGRAVEYAERMADEGADLIDVGGESTRPGASPVSAREEAARVVPVIRKLAHRLGPQTVISVDTYKAAVARRAVEAGVGVINDVSAGAMDREMFETVAELGVGYVIMHMRGEPRSMQMDTEYRDMMAEIYEFFESSLERARAAGIEREKIVLDPGIGFGKSA